MRPSRSPDDRRARPGRSGSVDGPGADGAPSVVWLSELRVELVLKVARDAGAQLRAVDPAALKDLTHAPWTGRHPRI